MTWQGREPKLLGMSDLLVPGGWAAAGSGPFERRFFAAHFKAGEPPKCDAAFADGEVPVVELELVNGRICDVFHFVAFRRDHIVAELFVDPPDCSDLYLSYIRYESVFRVNVRHYRGNDRKLGFKSDETEVDEDE